MPYESTITFTLDTICPWTYLGYLRLTKALSSFHSDKVTFTLCFAPYQLYPDFSQEGEDKYAWYRRQKYDEDKMAKYTRYMQALGHAQGIEFDFGGKIANTLHAHRILNHVQKEKGVVAARKSLESLYNQYFTERAHPSSAETLMKACAAGGLADTEAKRLVDDECEGLVDVKNKIREQAGNGVDSVPYVVFEGKRRDFTLVGAKEVEEYVKVLRQVEKEV